MFKSRALPLLMASSLLVLGVAACNRDKAPEPPSEAVAETGPLTYESTTPYAKVSLTLPEAIRSFPTFYKSLFDEEVNALKAYSEGAQSDRSEAGGADLPPYEKTIIYGSPVETDRLFSMIRTDFDYSGGAHSNTLHTGVLWDKSTNKTLTAADLLATDADRAALHTTLCDAINTAKKARPGANPVTDTSGTWTCPDLSKVPVALMAGDTPKKAAGLVFMINHYEVGPYVEGAYFISLPASALGQSLNPALAAEFAGTGPVGDVTEKLRPQ